MTWSINILEDRTARFLVPLLIFILGCSSSRERAPLPDSAMVNVLIDLHLAGARADVTDQVPVGMRDSVLAAHSIDSVTYVQAVHFYAEHPTKYIEVYSRVLDRLNGERIPLGPASALSSAPTSRGTADPSR